jgi:hypothetical protein
MKDLRPAGNSCNASSKPQVSPVARLAATDVAGGYGPAGPTPVLTATPGGSWIARYPPATPLWHSKYTAAGAAAKATCAYRPP